METNFEKIKDDLLKSIFVNDCGIDNRGRVLSCGVIECKNCIFAFGKCSDNKEKWLDGEPRSDKTTYATWANVPIDTPVIVWGPGSDKLVKGYFAGLAAGSRPYVKIWAYGKTSKTSIDGQCEMYYYGKLDEQLTEETKLRLRTDCIDWDNISIDTPVFVCDEPDCTPIIRHFAGAVEIDGVLNIAVWRNGRTHWTNRDDCREFYKYGYLVEE